MGGLCELNPRYTDRWISFHRMEFTSFYPNELRKILKNQTHLRPNISNFKKVFDLAMTIRNQMSIQYMNTSTHSEARRKLKYFINATFGMLSSPDSPLRFYSDYDTGSVPVNLNHIITRNTRMLLTLIKNEHPNHAFYVDTDCIHFRHFNEIRDRILAIKNDNRYSGHHFSIYGPYQGMFMAKKKYLYIDDGKVILRGIKNDITNQ